MTSQESDEPDVRAEPVPNWETARETWDWAWQLHTYGIGVGFLLLGLYSVYTSTVLFRSNKGKQLKPFFIAINMLVFLLCFLRSVFLLVDPYRSREYFSELLTQILFNVAFPCLTSGYGLVNWAFLETSKFKLLSPKIQNARILVAIIVGHFTFVLTVDFVVAFVADTWVLVMLCQGTFVLWGLILCIGFSYSAWRVYNIKSKTRTLYRVHNTAAGIGGKFKFRKSRDRQNSRNEGCGNCAASPGVTTVDQVTKPKRFSLTSINGTTPETYDSLQEESYNGPHDEKHEPTIDDHEIETNELLASSQLQENGETLINAEVIQSYNDVIVKTDLGPNHIVDANGTLYTVNARHDSENSRENEGFDGEPITDKNSHPQISSNQSNSVEMNLVSLEGPAETASRPKANSNSKVCSISQRASTFITSVRGTRFLGKKQYGVKSVIVNKKTTTLTTKMMRITVVTTTFAAIICLVSTYAMFGVFSVLAEEKELEPWGWYAFQTVIRLCELGMGVTMAYLTTTPPKTKTNSDQHSGRRN